MYFIEIHKMLGKDSRLLFFGTKFKLISYILPYLCKSKNSWTAGAWGEKIISRKTQLEDFKNDDIYLCFEYKNCWISAGSLNEYTVLPSMEALDTIIEKLD